MKYKGTTFICSAILTLLLGIGLETQTVKADDTNVAVTTAKNIQTNADNSGSQLVVPNDESIDSTIHKGDYPGGDWNITFDEATPKNNFYVSVNKDELEQNTKNYQRQKEMIASGDFSGLINSTVTSDEDVSEVNDDVSPINNPDAFYQKHLHDIATGAEITDSTTLKQAADFYQKNVDTLNNFEFDTLTYQKDIENIYQLKDYDQFSQEIQKLIYDGYTLPVTLSWTTNPQSQNDRLATMNQVSDEILHNIPSSRLDDNEITARSYYFNTAGLFLGILGFTSEQAHDILNNAIIFNDLLRKVSDDQSTTQFVFDQAEHPEIQDLNAFYNQTGKLNLAPFFSATYPNATRIQVYNSKLLSSMSSIFNNTNFVLMRDWVIAQSVTSQFGLFGKLGVSMMPITTYFDNIQDAIQNIAENYTMSYFPNTMSKLFGQNVVNNDDVQNVTSIVNKIISVYENRIENNTWLSDSGKKATIDKLKNINVFVGYPKSIPDSEDYSGLNLSLSNNLYDIEKAMNNHIHELDSDDFDKPIIKSFFGTSNVANAYYSPQANSIVVPARFMTDPMYSKDNSDSQNYGGIGVVIGHEISHAFDNQGINFNLIGDYQEIWSDQDRKEFNEQTDKILSQYDGIPFANMEINGKKTLAENIADNGGIHAAYQAAKELPGFNPKEFFEQYEKGLSDSVVPEQLTDVFNSSHTPSMIRGNVNVQNDDDFYTAFDVQPGDPMYLDPAKRITIW